MKESVYKLPSEFLARLRKIYPSYFESICNTFLSRKEQSFRVNYLKTSLRALRESLKRERVKYKELSWPKGAFILKSDLRHFQRTFIYREGLVYVQNLSSMIPPFVLSPQADDKILDLCAAPGAKTTQIVSLVSKELFSEADDNLTPQERRKKGVSLLGSDFELVAIEKIRGRYYKLLASLKIQGADFIEPLIYDGVWVRKKFPEHFNKLLLDSPCSSEGRFYMNNPRSFKYWKYRKVKEMAHKQKRLFSSAIRALVPGGILVYSTCTFSPEENEELIDWALNKFKYELELVPITLPLRNAVRGLKSWRGKKFSNDLKETLRIIPNESMEGFFVAKLKKC